MEVGLRLHPGAIPQIKEMLLIGCNEDVKHPF